MWLPFSLLMELAPSPQYDNTFGLSSFGMAVLSALLMSVVSFVGVVLVFTSYSRHSGVSAGIVECVFLRYVC